MNTERRGRALRTAPIVVVACLLVLPVVGRGPARLDVGTTLADALSPGSEPWSSWRGGHGNSRHEPRDIDLSPYRHLGSWIDIYNHWPWDHPVLAVRKLHRRGVQTIFLQTSNYGAKHPIFRPRATARFLKAAHGRKMDVVAWYVPSFAHPQIDFHRSRAAIKFKGRGHTFDSFALDIEATVVGNIWHRNRRLLDLSEDLRRYAGPRYSLGAITPDPVKSLYWPDFPYRRVGRLYDVFVPMGYFSFRADGYKRVKRYTSAGIRAIRRASGDRKVPIHFIGGIGGDTDPPEVKGFVRAAKGHEVIGASYYDFSATTDGEWKELEALAAPEPEPARPSEAKSPSPSSTSMEDMRPSWIRRSRAGVQTQKSRRRADVRRKASRGKDARARDRDRRAKKRTRAKRRDDGDAKRTERSRDRDRTGVRS